MSWFKPRVEYVSTWEVEALLDVQVVTCEAAQLQH